MSHTQAKVDHDLDFTRAKSIIATGKAVASAQLPATRACLEATHDE